MGLGSWGEKLRDPPQASSCSSLWWAQHTEPLGSQTRECKPRRWLRYAGPLPPQDHSEAGRWGLEGREHPLAPHSPAMEAHWAPSVGRASQWAQCFLCAAAVKSKLVLKSLRSIDSRDDLHPSEVGHFSLLSSFSPGEGRGRAGRGAQAKAVPPACRRRAARTRLPQESAGSGRDLAQGARGRCVLPPAHCTKPALVRQPPALVPWAQTSRGPLRPARRS